MKKSFVRIILSIIVCFVAFASCGCNNTSKYSLTVECENGLLYEPLGKSYNAGETVTVKTHIVCDAVLVATINGAPLQHTPVSENGTYTHWEFTFIMPNKESILELKTKDGILPPSIGLNNKIAYYDFSTNDYYGGFRMNAYIPTLQVWEEIKRLLPSFESDYDEQFFEQNALLILFGERGSCENRKIDSVEVLLNDYTINVTISAEKLPPDVSVPTAMANWVVVLEIENNVAFSNISVNAIF